MNCLLENMRVLFEHWFKHSVKEDTEWELGIFILDDIHSAMQVTDWCPWSKELWKDDATWCKLYVQNK